MEIEKIQKDIFNQLSTMTWQEHLTTFEHIHKITCERLMQLKEIGEQATKYLSILDKMKGYENNNR